MSNDVMRREMYEAIEAGERALSSLRIAQSKLNSAKNWGLFDMFGGDGLAGLVKHVKINDASRYVEEAKRDLLVFQRELKDVNVPLNLRIEVGGFLSFADFFLDGFIADYLVQSKISEARAQIDDAMYIVENIVKNLRASI